MARQLRADSKPAAPRERAEAAPAADSNITDETMSEIYAEALAKKIEHEKAVAEAKSANADFRAVLKRAKKLGISTDAITQVLADRKLEPDDVARRLAHQQRLYRLAHMEVGTQFSFDDAIDGAPVVGSAAGDAYDRGHELGVAGKGMDSDPTYTIAHPHRHDFLRGFEQGQMELMRRPGSPTYESHAQA